MNLARLGLLLVLTALVAFTPKITAQNEQSDRELTFHVDSRLVLVDVIPEFEDKSHARGLLTDLKREDFRLFDNQQEVTIRSFDKGGTEGSRPIALWFIVQCPQGFTTSWASDFLRGDVRRLRPALNHLGQDDVVGVAHWCDNGDAAIDAAPGRDADAALAKVDELLKAKITHGENRSGELAMQKLVRMVVENVKEAKPDRLPVMVFFYGDHCATYPSEAQEIIKAVLENSGIIFGISDGRWPFDSRHMMYTNGQIGYLVHYYSQETGGEYYTTPDPKLYSAALDYILAQVHLRYTLGFKPDSLDGKVHKLKLELTTEARSRYRDVTLRFRHEYLPVAQP
jgi:hypothetical protein